MQQTAHPYYKQPAILVAAGSIFVAVLITLLLFFSNHPTKKTSVVQKPTATASIIRPSLVASGFALPTNILASPLTADNHLYVTELRGTIQIVAPDGTLAAAPFLDISSNVLADGEQGLLGLTFDPGYAQNGYFYVNYIDKGQNTIIARYKGSANGLTGDPASEKVLLKLKQPYPNHNGGDLAFGPDGYLYAALGDGGSAGDPQNRSQDKTTYFGKILRLDVHSGDPYAVPATNPFVKEAGSKPEIWAYGLRNPWRFSFDKSTGDLYIADVGQSAVEEINMQPAGSKGGINYGWRCFEGNQPYNTAGCQDASHYQAPILSYGHDEGRCSVTGGYVYRGHKYPTLVGKYVYADFCGGQLYVAAKVNGAWQAHKVAQMPYSVSSFGQDNNGELYLADHAHGSIYHLEVVND